MQLERASKVFQALGSYVWDLGEKVNSEGTWSMASCPLAPWTHGTSGSGRDMNPSFSINVEPGPSICKCFSCDFSGTLATVVRKVHDYGGIDEETANKLLIYIDTYTDETFVGSIDDYTPDLPVFLTDYFNRPHEYIYERGFDDTDIATWALGYSDDLERMLVPFYSGDGTLQAVIGRDVTGHHPLKYMIYPQGFPRSKFLFGENHLTGDEDTILVVEGYLDAIAASKYVPDGVGVVAIGTAIPSTHQLRRLAGLAPEICLGLDNPRLDNAGLKGYEKAMNFLSGSCELTKLDYRQFKDAAEAGPKLPIIFEHRDRNLMTTPYEAMLNEMLGRLEAA